MTNAVLPALPDKIITKIIQLVGEESFTNLCLFIRMGKRSYGLVYETTVLKRCNIAPMVDTMMTWQLCVNGKFQNFFLKCVYAGNTEVVFYEALHLAVHSWNFREAIKCLKENVPTHGSPTLAYGGCNVSRGADAKASKAFHQLAVNHADLTLFSVWEWVTTYSLDSLGLVFHIQKITVRFSNIWMMRQSKGLVLRSMITKNWWWVGLQKLLCLLDM